MCSTPMTTHATSERSAPPPTTTEGEAPLTMCSSMIAPDPIATITCMPGSSMPSNASVPEIGAVQRNSIKNRNPINQVTALVQPTNLSHLARLLADRIGEFYPFEHAHRVRPERDRGTNVQERRRLFVNFRLDAEFLESESGSKTTNTAANCSDTHHSRNNRPGSQNSTNFLIDILSKRE